VTFLAPLFFAAGAAVAGAIVLLHFLARRRPRPAMLPTARFVPDRPARWPSRAPRPTDWLLLALRVLAVVAIAAAFARPVREPSRAVTTRIVLVDRSRAVADERAMRDSALAVVRDGDVVIAFDTTVRVVSMSVRDSIAVLARSGAPASLSAALVAAQRAAATVRDRADSIELAIVSPFASESWDDATWALRGRWMGRARLVSVPLARGDTASRAIDVGAPASDPVHAAAAPFSRAVEPRTRIVRRAPLPADSIWARGADHVLVHWPTAENATPATAEAVVAPDVVLAAPLVRRTLGNVDHARIVARFGDGSPAVIERAHGSGCIRDVAFDLPAVGDVALRESTRRLVRVVGAPCGDDEPRGAMTAARLDSLRGAGRLVAASVLSRPVQQRSAATSWLLIAGALLLLAEVGVRQRARRG
jgi:Aerotolerance regulator N-terminal